MNQQSLSTRPRRTRTEMSAQTQEALLARARAMFGTVGYADVALEDLTATVGLTRGALYHHFDSKLGLFLAVVAEIEREIDRAVTARIAAAGAHADDPWERLRIASHCYLETIVHPHLQQIMLKDAPSFYPGFGERPTRLHCHALTVQTLTELAAAGRLDIAEPEGATRMIEGAIAGLAFWASQVPGGDVVAARQLLDHFLDGFGAPA